MNRLTAKEYVGLSPLEQVRYLREIHRECYGRAMESVGLLADSWVSDTFDECAGLLGVIEMRLQLDEWKRDVRASDETDHD